MSFARFSRHALLFIVVAALFSASLRIWWNLRETPVTLPNGLVLLGDRLLSSDQKATLVADVEFLCFDDRFVMATSKTRGQGGLFDGRTGARAQLEGHPEIYEPGGLKFGHGGCNGYYTALTGPGLLGDRNRPPFLPPCESVNRENSALKNKDWLNRPCAER